MFIKTITHHKNFIFLQSLQDFCKKNDISLTSLAIGWLLSHSNIPSVICGIRSIKQLSENVSAINVELNPNHLKIISNIYFNEIEGAQ